MMASHQLLNSLHLVRSSSQALVAIKRVTMSTPMPTGATAAEASPPPERDEHLDLLSSSQRCCPSTSQAAMDSTAEAAALLEGPAPRSTRKATARHECCEETTTTSPQPQQPSSSAAMSLLSATTTTAETYCSVLNLVIDYHMAPPVCEFEPDETKKAIQPLVPIIRIFGPIVFFTDHPEEDEHVTTKSSCLFIHGAYPYMIARPVRAGMDGRPCRVDDDSSPWDSVSAVQRMIQPIQIALEDALQAMNQSLNEKKQPKQQQQHNNNQSSSIPSSSALVRRISVVTGRGFYTYCDGPVAPFLRVEYYCPADRWKIKRCLEQGLADLPKTYHPFYFDHDKNCDNDDDSKDHDEPPETLQFHCFEAHIPYTMQFFKDYNLAGAAYVHLDDTVKCRGTTTNNPPPYNASPLPKQTSCPVEVDATVNSILNVIDIITETQEEDDAVDERGQNDGVDGLPIHWRAVPSLKEIWFQERRRMKKLLGTDAPLKSFQSQLAANHSSATESAVRGMERLVEVTQGLPEALERATRDIVQRHQSSIAEHDAMILQSNGGVQTVGTGNKTITKNLTPVDDDAIRMLDNLGNMFEKIENSGGGDGYQRDDMGASTGLSRSQAFHSSGHKRQSKAVDEFELSQKMERGEAIIDDNPFESLDDAIDPETLLPYAPEDEESSDEEDEQTLERQLATLASQAFDNDVDDANDHYGLDSRRSPINPDSPNIAIVNQRSTLVEQSKAMAVRIATANPHEPASDNNDHDELASKPSPNHLAKVDQQATSVEQSKDISVIVATAEREETAIAGDTDAPMEWNHDQCVVIQPSKRVPISSELQRQAVQLHPIPHGFPCWIPFISKYTSAKRAPASIDPPIGIVLPTKYPPTKAVLLRWCEGREQSNSTTASKRNITSKKRRCPADSNVVSTANNHVSTPSTLSAEISLQGICNQGGRILVEKGGQLKARTKATQLNSQDKREMKRNRSDHLPCPVQMMSVEIYVQRRVSRTGIDRGSMIALTADSEKDSVCAIVLVLALDPGGGESLLFAERYILFVPVGQNQTTAFSRSSADKESQCLKRNMPSQTLGVNAPLHVECLADERQLLLRFASLVRWKDPDLLMSWDTQGAGLGYIIERGLALTKIQNQRVTAQGIDMARLLGRTSTPPSQNVHGKRLSTDTNDFQSDLFVSAFPEVDHGPGSTAALDRKNHWKGSGLGGDWDDKVGAGQAASSIVRGFLVRLARDSSF
jgi:hypothetical protein